MGKTNTRYSVVLHEHQGLHLPREARHRKQLPAALHQFDVLAYETLKRFALLDTQAAHDTVKACRAIRFRTFTPGASYFVPVRGTSYTVAITREV